MRILAALLITVFCSLSGFGQEGGNIERVFESNRLKYKLEIYAVGEDSSSGYDYLAYTSKGKVVKIREVWSSTSYANYRAEDYYFDNGKLIALVKYTFPKRHYNAVKGGGKKSLKLVEALYLTDAKLTSWTENGQPIPSTDPRWSETEKQILEGAGHILDGYRQFKEESR
jgi:hypothetical protein